MATDDELRAPHAIPLKGDGLAAQSVLKNGPYNGGSRGDEIALARYRDWQHETGRLDDSYEFAKAYWRAQSHHSATETPSQLELPSQRRSQGLRRG